MIGHIFATPLLERLRNLQVSFNRHDAKSAKQRQDLLNLAGSEDSASRDSSAELQELKKSPFWRRPLAPLGDLAVRNTPQAPEGRQYQLDARCDESSDSST